MKQQMRRSTTALVTVMALCAASIPTAAAQESSTATQDPTTDVAVLDGLDPQAEVLVIDVGEGPGDLSTLVVDVNDLTEREQHEVASDLEIMLDADATAQVLPAGEAESQLALDTTVGAALREAGAPQGGGGVVTAMKTCLVYASAGADE